MDGVALERQFAGQARLVRLLLWRVGDSTDLDACIRAAEDANMITAADAAFLMRCMDAEERARDAGYEAALAVTPEDIRLLRRCADKLNRADSA